MGKDMKTDPIGFTGCVENGTHAALSAGGSSLLGISNHSTELTNIETNAKKHQAQASRTTFTDALAATTR